MIIAAVIFPLDITLESGSGKKQEMFFESRVIGGERMSL